MIENEIQGKKKTLEVIDTDALLTESGAKPIELYKSLKLSIIGATMKNDWELARRNIDAIEQMQNKYDNIPKKDLSK